MLSAPPRLKSLPPAAAAGAPLPRSGAHGAGFLAAAAGFPGEYPGFPGRFCRYLPRYWNFLPRFFDFLPRYCQKVRWYWNFLPRYGHTAARNALPGLVMDLKAEMEDRAIYVEQTTGGDASKIPVSGFAVAGTPGVPIGPLPRPENVKAVMGDFPGTIKVSCEPKHGAQFYVTDCRLHDEPGQTWQQVKLSTKSRNEVTGLVSGKNYAFRMTAVGAAGQSPWGDEAVCMAP